jgi:hypothetical protein
MTTSALSLTEAGIKAAKDSPRRLDAAKKLLADMCGERAFRAANVWAHEAAKFLVLLSRYRCRDETLVPLECEIVAPINLPSASSRDPREACMACIHEAPIR